MEPTTAAQSWGRAPGTLCMLFRSRNMSFPSRTVTVPCLLKVVWDGVVSPHGYAPISSEWASIFRVKLSSVPPAANFRPTSTARLPSGTRSVRVRVMPP